VGVIYQIKPINSIIIFLIDSLGRLHLGDYKPEDNIDCTDGKYAAHTGGGNTSAIGIGLCGMYGFKNFKDPGKFPLTKVQVEACFNLCAMLCKKYNIPPSNVMTHYEFGISNPNTTSKGKIDIIYLPPYPSVSAEKIGDFIRQKVRWYLQSAKN